MNRGLLVDSIPILALYVIVNSNQYQGIHSVAYIYKSATLICTFYEAALFAIMYVDSPKIRGPEI